MYLTVSIDEDPSRANVRLNIYLEQYYCQPAAVMRSRQACSFTRPSSKVLLNPKGNKVRLTDKETAVLRYLYRAGQRPVHTPGFSSASGRMSLRPLSPECPPTSVSDM